MNERMDRVEAGLERITQRLDRPAERHEALAQGLEVTASMQRDAKARMAQILTARRQDVETIRALARVADQP